jgi:hypothetical protein
MQKLILGIGAVLIIALGVWWFSSNENGNAGPGDGVSAVPTTDPLDVVLAFYGPWLEAVQSTTTDPYQANLNTDAVLSTAVQLYLAESLGGEQDPVLCQSTVPEEVRGRELFRTDSEAEVQILSRGLPERSPTFALVRLSVVDGAWQISEITCRSGESGPEREFSFEREGHLLKSVPPPLNPEYWHLVYTENNIPGQTVPLFFNETSQCQVDGGELFTCDPSQLQEADYATVRGEMTESGVEVRIVAY